MSTTDDLLDDIAVRAQRQLDGMTINRDRLARDCLGLVRAIKHAQAAAQRAGEHTPQAALADGFAEIFRNIFGDHKA